MKDNHASSMNDAKQEWAIHQRTIENYELASLVIKLIATIILSLLFIFNTLNLLTTGLILVFWGLDVIWKTFQQRTEQRILVLEQYIHSTDTTKSIAFQFHTSFLDQRGGISALIKEYISNSIKPTIAYPYIVLVVLAITYSMLKLI